MDPMVRRAFVLVLSWTLSCLAPIGSHAADGIQDQLIVTEAVSAALEYQESGASVPWANAATGNSGTITVLRAVFRGGRSCRQYEWTLENNGSVLNTVTGTGCRNNNGTWALSEDGSPATVQTAALPAVTAPPVGIGDARRVLVWAYRTAPETPRDDLYQLSEVYAQELLETVPEGALHVVLRDGAEIRLGSASQVRLDEFVYNPDSGAGKVTASLGKGVFRFITGKVKGDDFQVRTPTALIGVRGTDFLVAVAPSSFTIVHVNTGSVLVTPFGGASPESVNAGETLGIDPAGQSTTTSAAAPRDAGLDSTAGTSPAGFDRPGGAGTDAPSSEETSDPSSSPSSGASSSRSGGPKGGGAGDPTGEDADKP